VATTLVADRTNVKTKKVTTISPAFGCELAFKSDQPCTFALCTWCKQEEQAIADSVPEKFSKNCKKHSCFANLVAYDDTSYLKNKSYIKRNPFFAHVCVKCNFDFGTSKQAPVADN